jgi:hypothetical protein
VKPIEKTQLWLAVAGVAIGMIALIPGYFILWAKPDLVYEEKVVNIPLPETLGKDLPNVLVLLKLQNTGHRPSEGIQGNISVHGELLYYEVHTPNPAYAQVEVTRKASELDLRCPRLTQGEYPINISLWTRGKLEEPDTAFADSMGAIRRVVSVDEESHKLRKYAWFFFSVGAALVTGLGFLFGALYAVLGLVGKAIVDVLWRVRDR